MDFKKELEAYIKKLDSEKQFTFFCIPLGFSKPFKKACAKKILNELNGEKVSEYSVEELHALSQARLGKLMQKYSEQAHEKCRRYSTDEIVNNNRENAIIMNRAALRFGDKTSYWN